MPALPPTTLTPGMQVRAAVCANDVAALKALLVKDPQLVHDRADVGENGAMEGMLTALHVACQLGREECCELILQMKPDVNATSEAGRSALHFACQCGNPTCCELLIQHGAKVHAQDFFKQTPKEIARESCAPGSALCMELIEAEEIRFGRKVVKVGASIFTLGALGAAAYWYWRTTVQAPGSEENAKKN